MTDWVNDAASVLWDTLSTESTDNPEKSIAEALRKAKADGMREAVSMMGGIFVNEFDAANQKVAREQVIIRAAEIEKGKE